MKAEQALLTLQPDRLFAGAVRPAPSSFCDEFWKGFQKGERPSLSGRVKLVFFDADSAKPNALRPPVYFSHFFRTPLWPRLSHNRTLALL